MQELQERQEQQEQQPKAQKRSVSYFMRALHRDVGFFVVGLVLVYSLSGMVLVYRDAGLLVSDVRVEKQLSPGLGEADLGKQLPIKGLRVTKTEGDTVQFREGTYDKSSGMAAYTVTQLPWLLQKFVNLHKIVSGKPLHWYAMLFGVLLSFLAVSSFWMYQKGSGAIRRGLCIATAGVVVTAVVLFL